MLIKQSPFNPNITPVNSWSNPKTEALTENSPLLEASEAVASNVAQVALFIIAPKAAGWVG